MFIHGRVFHFIAKTDVSEKFLCTKIVQSTADLFNLLHIVNDSVDIVHNKRLFSREVIKNTNRKEEENWRSSLLISEKVCMFMSMHRCLKQTHYGIFF